VDLYDGRPIYVQRDARTVNPALVDGEAGFVVGRHVLYYKRLLGGWAVHTVVGSAQAVLFSPSDGAMAHDLHGLRTWERVVGEALLPDRRLHLINLALDADATAAAASPFAPPGARLLSTADKAAAQAGYTFAPGGNLCPQGAPLEPRFFPKRAFPACVLSAVTVPCHLLARRCLSRDAVFDVLLPPAHRCQHRVIRFHRPRRTIPRLLPGRAHGPVRDLPARPLWGLERANVERGLHRVPAGQVPGRGWRAHGFRLHQLHGGSVRIVPRRRGLRRDLPAWEAQHSRGGA